MTTDSHVIEEKNHLTGYNGATLKIVKAVVQIENFSTSLRGTSESRNSRCQLNQAAHRRFLCMKYPTPTECCLDGSLSVSKFGRRNKLSVRTPSKLVTLRSMYRKEEDKFIGIGDETLTPKRESTSRFCVEMMKLEEAAVGMNTSPKLTATKVQRDNMTG
ncbi:hypothetical protein H5410_059290 [Solanum commersonii]|uniref:Uncharacterized protein n=1 Tax=Solanum commersonii TaxID=4109 RepID=A0A9J5W2I0_SOLCO|nr:hypothetical protein H5410_059290 [Solanum commersonii]